VAQLAWRNWRGATGVAQLAWRNWRGGLVVMAGLSSSGKSPGAAADVDAAAARSHDRNRKRKNPGRFRERGFSWRITTGTS
jgi:hypothetical protein